MRSSRLFVLLAAAALGSGMLASGARAADAEAPAASESGSGGAVANDGGSAPARPTLAPAPGPDGSGPEGSAEVAFDGELHDLQRDPWNGNPELVKPEDHGAFIRGNKNALVLLTAKNCHLCRRITREFSRAEWLARVNNVPVKFGVVETETDEGTALMKRLNVGALPVMFLNVNNGKERLYLEEWWSAEPLIADVQMKLGHMQVQEPVRDLETVEDVPAWLFDRANDQGSFPTTAVLFAPHPGRHIPALAEANDACIHEFIDAARALAFDEKASFRNRPRFARVMKEEVVRRFGLPMDRPSVVLYKDYDEGKAVFNGTCGERLGAIKDFVQAEGTPRVVVANHGNIKDHMTRGTNVIHAFLPGFTLEDPRALGPIKLKFREALARLEQAQLVERGEFMVYLSNGHQYHLWMKDYGLTKNVFPAIGVDVTDRRRRYALPRHSTAREVVAPTAEEEAARQAESDEKPAPTPDPMTGLLPAIPVDPRAEVDVSVDEIVAGIADVIERRAKADVVYGDKRGKVAAAKGKGPAAAKKAAGKASA